MAIDQKTINSKLRKGGSKLEGALKSELMSYLKSSSEELKSHWLDWDVYDWVYRGFRLADDEDVENAMKGRLVKGVVPIVFAQINTAIAFLFSAFTQRKMFFEIIPQDPTDSKGSRAMERDLDWQVRNMDFKLVLYRWLLDTFKYGFGIVRTHWEVKTGQVRARPRTQPASPFGGNPPGATTDPQVVEVTTYEGNIVKNVSPFSFIFDPSVPIARFQEGLFCGHEQGTSLIELVAQEGVIYHGTDKIPDITDHIWGLRPRRHDQRQFVGATSTARKAIITEVQFKLIPSVWTKTYNVDFGNSKKEEKWIATIANDSKVIRLEPLGYLHNRFTYSMIEYSPDERNFINPGLSSTVHRLQETLTWLFNSRVANVMKFIKNRYLADTTKANVDDLANDREVIRVRESAMGNIDNSVKQLQVSDATVGHLSDMGVVQRLIELATGINENASGQFSSGRRSAQEARNVQAGATSRLRMQGELAFDQGIKDLGQQIITNTRQSRSPKIWVKIQGSKLSEAPFEEVILTDPDSMAGNFDFLSYNVTLPSDKSFQANTLKEVLTALLSSPELAAATGLSPKKILDLVAELIGIKDLPDLRQEDGEAGAAPTPDVQQFLATGQGQSPVQEAAL